MYNLDLRKRYRSLLILAACLLAASGLPSSALAECLAGENARFTLLVDASSSCAALSGNMTGCETDANGLCIIDNPQPSGADIVIQVTPSDAVGSVPIPPGLVSWQVQSGPQALLGQEIDFVISLGATGGGTCGTSYTPGEGGDTGLGFQKSNGSYQKVNGLFFCSDFAAPPPSVPRLTLRKTVMLAGGSCGIDDVENLGLKVGMDVQYCFDIENFGIGGAVNVSLSDPAIFTTPVFIGNLAAGGSTTITSPLVTIGTQGEIVNSATVSGDAADDPSFLVPDDTDTATVNAQLALELCPDDYQAAVDGEIFLEDGFKYAALLDPLNPDRLSICVPSNVDSNVSCVNQCILKDICKDPNDISYDPLQCDPPFGSKCEESGNWSVGSSASDCQIPVTSELPYCWEAIQDRDQNCEYKAVEPLQSLDINVEQYHDNPFCYLSCADISDLKTCNYICF